VPPIPHDVVISRGDGVGGADEDRSTLTSRSPTPG